MKGAAAAGAMALLLALTAGRAAAAPAASAAILASVINPPVVVPGRLAGRLSLTPAAAGQPVQAVLSVTNTGGMTVTALVGRLRTDGGAAVGAVSPAVVEALAPGASAAFTWTVAPSELRTLTLFALAAGFTTDATGVVPVAAPESEAVLTGIPAPAAGATFVYPSPARNVARIAYTMAAAGAVTLKVYSAAGRLVAALEEAKPAGVQSTSVTTSLLAPGVYVYLLERVYGAGGRDRLGRGRFVVAR